MTLPRVPETALIEDKEEINSWNIINRTLIDTSFAEWFKFRKDKSGTIVNLGCGIANLEIALLDQIYDLKFLSVDGSAGMIEVAKQNIHNNGLDDNVTLKNCMIEDVGHIPDCKTVISHGVLHHFEDPYQFWNAAIKIPKSGGILMIMDLIRPNTDEEVEEIISEWGQNNSEYIDSLRRSLHAAFTEDEIKEQLNSLGLEHQVLSFSGPDAGNLMMISVTTK